MSDIFNKMFSDAEEPKKAVKKTKAPTEEVSETIVSSAEVSRKRPGTKPHRDADPPLPRSAPFIRCRVSEDELKMIKQHAIANDMTVDDLIRKSTVDPIVKK